MLNKRRNKKNMKPNGGVCELVGYVGGGDLKEYLSDEGIRERQ